MSSLSRLEKIKLEKYFDMQTGYVCDFSNRTFADFVKEITGVDVYSEKYNVGSGSKAVRLRSFWNREPDEVVGNLLKEMLEYWRVQKLTPIYGYSGFNKNLYRECISAVKRILSAGTIDNINSIEPNSLEEGFAILAKSIKENIQKGDFYQSLDRLHTFVVKYIRELCKKHSLDFTQTDSLAVIFKKYINFLKSQDLIKSKMTDRILKCSISLLASFDNVRNTESLAHDNKVINQRESSLIVSNIVSIINFIGLLEKQLSKYLSNNTTKNSFSIENTPTENEVEAAVDA